VPVHHEMELTDYNISLMGHFTASLSTLGLFTFFGAGDGDILTVRAAGDSPICIVRTGEY